MSPELTAQALLALFALSVMLGVAEIFSWMHKTVFPDVWETGEQFGIEATRGEILIWKACHVLSVGLKLAVLVVLARAVLAAF